MKKGAEYTPDINRHRIYTMYSEAYLNAIEEITPYYNNFHTIADNFSNTAQ